MSDDDFGKGEHRQCVTFRLDEEVYGINVMLVQEVLRVTEIAPVPGAPNYVIGIINLRGNVVTVIDTRMRFGLPPREMDDSTRIVIIEAENQTVGIIVDSVSEVVDIYSNEIETAPNVGNDETARYVYRILAMKCILSDPEQYGFHVDEPDMYNRIPYHEIEMDSSINNIAEFAKAHGTNYKILKKLNPWLRANTLTNKNNKKYIIRIPEAGAREFTRKKK